MSYSFLCETFISLIFSASFLLWHLALWGTFPPAYKIKTFFFLIMTFLKVLFLVLISLHTFLRKLTDIHHFHYHLHGNEHWLVTFSQIQPDIFRHFLDITTWKSNSIVKYNRSKQNFETLSCLTCSSSSLRQISGTRWGDSCFSLPRQIGSPVFSWVLDAG